jgi:hypothetical protein
MAAAIGLRAERRKSSAEAYSPLASVRPRRRSRISLVSDVLAMPCFLSSRFRYVGDEGMISRPAQMRCER